VKFWKCVAAVLAHAGFLWLSWLRDEERESTRDRSMLARFMPVQEVREESTKGFRAINAKLGARRKAAVSPGKAFNGYYCC
jgi:hypothetical protein